MADSTVFEAASELAWWALAKAPMVLAGAALTAWVLRDASAATRHRVWSTAVIAVLALPVLGLLVPRLPLLSVPEATRDEAVVVGTRVDARVRPAVAAAARGPAAMAGPTGRGPRIAAAPAAVGVHAPRAPSAVHPAVAPAVAGAPVMPLSAGATALLIWAVVATGLLLRLAMSWRRTRRLERLRVDVSERALGRAVRRMAAEYGARDVRVLLGAPDAMPVTWGARRPVLLLPDGADTWSPRRLQAVVRHELAHVGRGDVALQMLADVLCALHWFDPFAWYAAHRMRVERELACDDEVLAAGTRPSDYASELVGLARTFREGRAAGVAMARRAGLRARVECVLDERRRRGASRGVNHGIHLVAGVLVLPLAAFAPRPADAHVADAPVAQHVTPANAFVPHVAQPTVARATVVPAFARPAQLATLCWADTRDGASSVRRNNDRFELDWTSGDCVVDIRIDGELSFSDDFTRITGITRGGLARFEERDGRSERRVDLRPGGGGIERRWWVDGAERPFDDEAQRWLDAMLLNTFRSGGLATEERAAWILREQGLDALMQEMQYLRSDWVEGMYMQAALASPDMDDMRAVRLVRHAGETIESDHTLQQILETVAATRSLANAELRAAYLAAVGSIESDHSRGRVLDAALSVPSLPDRDLATILDAVAGIESDHEKSELLVAVAQHHRLTPELRAAYLRVTASIESDHSTGRAAHALLDAGEPTAEELSLALDVAAHIDSDHEQGELMRRLGRLDLRNDDVRSRYEAALRGIDSDHTLGTVLLDLMEERGVDAATAGVVLRVAPSIESDHTLGEVLSRLATRGGVTDANRAAFEDALDSISSDHTREQVRRALQGR